MDDQFVNAATEVTEAKLSELLARVTVACAELEGIKRGLLEAVKAARPSVYERRGAVVFSPQKG
jgi:hypothetical protein